MSAIIKPRFKSNHSMSTCVNNSTRSPFIFGLIQIKPTESRSRNFSAKLVTKTFSPTSYRDAVPALSSTERMTKKITSRKFSDHANSKAKLSTPTNLLSIFEYSKDAAMRTSWLTILFASIFCGLLLGAFMLHVGTNHNAQGEFYLPNGSFDFDFASTLFLMWFFIGTLSAAVLLSVCKFAVWFIWARTALGSEVIQRPDSA